MAYEELFPTRGVAQPAAKIVIAPPDIDVSPQVSIHMPRAPYIPYYALFRAGQAVQDFLKTAMQSTLIDKLRAELPGLANWPMSICTDAVGMTPSGLATRVLREIGDQYKFLMDAWKAGIGAGMGAAYASEIEQFMNPGQLLYSYSMLQHMTSVVPRMRRHWMSVYTPTVPNTSMAYNLMLRGAITESQFNTLASYDGWDPMGIGHLKDAWMSVPAPWAAFRLLMRGRINWELFTKYLRTDGWLDEKREPGMPTWNELFYSMYETFPTAHEAFYIWKKDLIDEKTRNSYYNAAGYDSRMWNIITENWYYTPTIYDLTRIADYVELDQIWAIDMMKKRGVRDKDIAKIWEMLELRPLREEYRNLTGKALYCRQHGYWSHDGLNDYFIDLKIKPRERELLNEYGDLLYNVEVLEERIEVLRWRFRTARISVDEFHQGLLDLGIDEVKANLMVEVEIAKGYFGYIYPGVA